MSFFWLGVVCATVLTVLFGALKGLTFFFQKKIEKGYKLELSTFLFGTGAIFGLVALITFGIIFYPFTSDGSLQVIGIAALGLGTVFLTKAVVPNKAYRVGLLYALCLCGTLFIPQDAVLWQLPFSGVLCAVLALVWMGFMVMMRTLDRVMLVSFLTLSALMIGIVLLSSAAFPFFPVLFSTPFLFLLLLLIGHVYYLKNNGCYILGQPTVFFLSYLIGFMGMTMFARGKGLYAPIFVSYELFEIVGAMGVNFWLYKRFTPIEAPFMVERALMKNIAPGKVLRSVFMWCIFFPMLGVVGLFTTGYLWPIYLFVAFCLLAIYNRLKDWGKPKVRFRDLFSDIKLGLRAFKEEMNNIPLKKDKTPPKHKKKK